MARNWANIKNGLGLLQATALAVLLGVVVYPREPDYKVTDFDGLTSDMFDGGSDTKHDNPLGTNQLFYNVHIRANNPPYLKATGSVSEVDCDYTGDMAFKARDACKEMRYLPAMFGIVLVVAVLLMACEHANNNTLKSAAVYGSALASIWALAAVSRIHRLFLANKEVVGDLNDQGKSYFGLLIAFSTILFVAAVARIGAHRMLPKEGWNPVLDAPLNK